MNRLRGISWGRLAAIAVIAVGVGYAPIAMTELWPYAHPGAPAIGESFLAHVTNPRYVADALATRIRPYQHSLAALVVHSVLGGLLMLLGPLQLLTAVRRRVRLHRTLGVVFAVTVYVCMAGAAVYLLRTAPRDAFSGPRSGSCWGRSWSARSSASPSASSRRSSGCRRSTSAGCCCATGS